MNEAATEELQAFKAAFFRALAHPVRIRILELLVTGEIRRSIPLAIEPQA